MKDSAFMRWLEENAQQLYDKQPEDVAEIAFKAGMAFADQEWKESLMRLGHDYDKCVLFRTADAHRECGSDAIHELRKVCQCLYLAVEPSIANDVKKAAEAVIALVAPTPPPREQGDE